MLWSGFKSFAYKILIMIIALDVLMAKHEKKPGIIYILHWVRPGIPYPFEYWRPKRKSFTIINCEFQNCYLTDNKEYFDDFTLYDAILFTSAYMSKVDIDFPTQRSDNQIYIFAGPESSTNYPARDTSNWFFNYTWTYKLNSDIPYPYIVARNKSTGEIIAPKEKVQWLNVKAMEPISDSVKDRLKSKKTAVAWFASNCDPDYSYRYRYVMTLQNHLADHSLDLDIYGLCGALDCKKDYMDDCLAKIESDYYFYLSFENSFCEDYVTEKLLTALNNFAVPIVMGGADYSRFMPDGIYLNYKLGEEKIAEKIHALINNTEEYYNYFKWHNHYSFHNSEESADSDPMCALCAFLNGNWRSQRRVYTKFTDWWNEEQHTQPQYLENDTIVYYETDINTTYLLENPKAIISKPKKTSNVVGEFVNNLFSYVFQ